jgi:curved DNA-binding protein CbpA
MYKNYYAVLGLIKSASKSEVKSKFRELAKKWHPDVCKEPDATQRMQEITEAYLILYDDEARFRYDKIYSNTFERKETFQQEYQSQKTYSKKNVSEIRDDTLDKWILKAQKQAIEILQQSLDDVIGISKRGCLFFFYSFGLSTIIYVIVVILALIIMVLWKKT